jgi:hypothetical protein
MSKIALSPNALGTGTFTIASPNGNTDRTLNLPDASGTVQVSGQPVTATTGNFSGNVTLGSSVLATPTGSAPSYTCRAWVNFNGTGTVAIRASGNVSSITDNGTGFYTVNFGTAMPDSNYAVLFTPGGQETTSTANLDAPARSTTPTATAVQMTYSHGNQDTLFGSVAIFR